MKIYTTDREREYYTDEGCFITEIINSEVHPNISIAQARVESGKSTELHALSGTQEIYYITQGEGIASIDGTELKLGIGDCIVIHPKCPQAIHSTGSADLKFLCICQPRFQIKNYKALT